MAYRSGTFRTSQAAALALVETRLHGRALAALAATLAIFPWLATPFLLDLANQVGLAVIGAVALMLLTGYAGQVSLGHAGLMAAGALTTGILVKEIGAPVFVTLPAAALVGGALGLVFGLPSLRLKGLYLAIGTLALHFVVEFAGKEYETQRNFSTGMSVPRLIASEIAWYYLFLAVDVAVVLFALNLLRSRTGRAWCALRDREVVAAAMGIPVARYKLYAFVLSSVLTAVAGALFAHYRSFVTTEAFTLLLSIQYIAMVIVGGMGSIAGAVLGAGFITLLPYAVQSLVGTLAGKGWLAANASAVNYSAFGLVMILFLVFEPQGLMGLWRRLRDYFVLWPFRHRARG
jgi:branched-chain amino acid transport system permease protein